MTGRWLRISIIALAVTFPLALMAQKGNPGKAPAKATGDPVAGKTVFQKNCAVCHHAEKVDRKIGPGMKGIFKGKDLPMSHKPNTEANVRLQIEKGNPKKGMPAFETKLSKADMENLVAYLKTL